MSCFFFLKIICDEINVVLFELWWGKVLFEFWWGKGEERRKILWVFWKKLCLLKKEGCMGFRDLYSFNKVLFVK